jgi:hypothetical protein
VRVRWLSLCPILATLLAPATARADAGALGTVTWELRAHGGPPATSGFALAYDAARKNVVLFGGTGSGGTANAATWLWDGASWREAQAGVAPPARTEHAMAFDAARGKVVLFGGLCSQCTVPLADTWEWDGAAWQAAVESGPSARSGAAMAFDPARGKVVLFGGVGVVDADAGTIAPMADTWELDGAGWHPKATAVAPAVRAGAAITYDENLHAILLYGGYTRLLPPLSSNAYGDAWAYDGTTWRDVTDASVPLRNRFWAGLVFDSARRRSILFSGFPCLDCFGDARTWELDGTSWLIRGPSGQFPTLKIQGAATFDTARRRTVFVVDELSDLQTWEYYGFAGSCGSDGDCDTGHCNGGICCTQTCGVCSDCDFTGTACAPVERKDDLESCTGTSTCDPLGRCANKLGQACAKPGDCASGLCTGGVCCAVDACGTFACGPDGLCRTACANAGDCAGGATCLAGACQPSAGACDGDVAVAVGGGRTPCAPFACGPAGCLAACGSSDDCAAGHLCGDARACVPTPPLSFPGCATGGGGGGALAGLVALLAAAMAGARRSRREG